MKTPQSFLGITLPGDCTLDRFIGAGAFAWVYHAKMGKRSVAVKLLNDSATDASRKLFLREIKVLRRMRPSPYLVRYVADGTLPDATPYLTMEYVDGVNLKDALRVKPKWSEVDASKLMLQLCDALGGLHSLGAAHRDLKPANIMVTRQGRVKLMDFGLIKDAQGLLNLFEKEDLLEGRDFGEDIDSALLAGTPEYSAPEQLTDALSDPNKARTDTWTDVYSLGLIFFELLTGTKRYNLVVAGNDAKAYQRALITFIQARTTERDEPLPRPPQVNEELWAIVNTALRIDPKRRPRTAADFARSIERYLSSGETSGVWDAESTSPQGDSNLASLANIPQPFGPVDDEPTTVSMSLPFDLEEVEAQRDARLNAPGGPSYTIPPGVFTAGMAIRPSEPQPPDDTLKDNPQYQDSAFDEPPAHTANPNAATAVLPSAGKPAGNRVPLLVLGFFALMAIGAGAALAFMR